MVCLGKAASGTLIRCNGMGVGWVHTDRTFECGPSPLVTGVLLLISPLV